MKNKAKMFPLNALFQHCNRILDNTVRQEKEIKCMQTGNEEIKLCLVASDMIASVVNAKELTEKPLQVISSQSKDSRYKVNTQKSITIP